MCIIMCVCVCAFASFSSRTEENVDVGVAKYSVICAGEKIRSNGKISIVVSNRLITPALTKNARELIRRI